MRVERILNAVLIISLAFSAFGADNANSVRSKETPQNPDGEKEYLEAGKYWFGDGVKQDREKAATLYETAAGKEYIPALVSVGDCYSRGEGRIKDETLAVAYYRKAAESGDVSGQSRLGAHYWFGSGVERNPRLAANWLEKAAKQGEYLSQRILGEMYFSGDGVPRDLVLSYMWINLASVKDKSAQDFRDGMEQFMSREQIAEAQRLSREFVPTDSRGKNGRESTNSKSE